MRRTWSAVAFGLLVLALIELRGSATAQSGTTNTPITVYLVRHADKKDSSENSPLKDPEGFDRAKALADALADKDIVLIVTSTFKRTVQTAEPLAKKLGKKATVRKVSSVESVVSMVRAAKGNVLVVHHSNTVPEIIATLTKGQQISKICDPVYDRLFLLRFVGGQFQLNETRYGAPSPPANC
jgi:broad specificity phosphatase PhoE